MIQNIFKLNIYNTKMKKILLVIFALAGIGSASAQSLQITKGGVDYTNGNYFAWFDVNDYTGTNAVTLIGFSVKNTASSTKSYRMYRTVQVLADDTTKNYFCWDACYPDFVDTSSGVVPIQANNKFDDMSLDYQPNGIVGITVIRYIIQDVNNLSDTTSITVHYSATPTGIKAIAASKIAALYPNPAVDAVTINYTATQGQNTLEIRNMLGQVQQMVQLSNTGKSYNLNLSNFAPGVYFVTLRSNGVSSDVKRLVVN